MAPNPGVPPRESLAGMSSSDGSGWSSADPHHSCGYLAEPIVDILGALQVGSFLDLGSGTPRITAFDLFAVARPARGPRTMRSIEKAGRQWG